MAVENKVYTEIGQQLLNISMLFIYLKNILVSFADAYICKKVCLFIKLKIHNLNKKIKNMQEEVSLYRLTNIVQSSSLAWPREQHQRDQLSLPLSLTLHPLEQFQSQDLSASFSGANINQYRCRSCKAFVNHYCEIKNKNEYKCSICGCTNWLPCLINPQAPQFTSPVFTCKTQNPSFRTNSSNYRTFVFAIDLSQYDLETNTIVHYVADIIRDFLKQIQQKCKETDKKRISPNRIKIMIVGFSDSIYQYRLVNNIEKHNYHDRSLSSADQQIEADKQKQQIQIKNEEQQHEIQKFIDTHLEISPQDISADKQKYFIQLPKFTKHIQQILVDLIDTVKNGKLSNSSNAILPLIEKIMHFTSNSVGKVYVISGLRNSKGPFASKLQNQPEQFRSNFNLNKKKCLPSSLIHMLQKTHMSVSFFIYNNNFINLMPLYIISKMTNGELKHYNSNNYHQFYYQLYYSICNQSFQLGTQTILKVRYSAGLKLIGTFGQYRSNKGAQDQIQLLSCPLSRLYMFQFAIQGKIQKPYINIQFSILWTDIQGNRIFKVITHSQKVTDNKQQILDSINYGVMNQSYLWAVLYNMDLNVKVKNLQVTLQERCRKHLKAIQKYKQGQTDAIKKATPYIIFTYYLIGHFIINTRYGPDRVYDKSIQARSRIITSDISGIYAVWPVVYSINKKKIKIVQLRYSQIKNSQIAVVIDQADFCYVYIVSEDMRNQVTRRKLENNRLLIQIIGQITQLQPLSGILKQIREEKTCGYMEIILLESLQGAYVLDENGPKSYTNFITNLVS